MIDQWMNNHFPDLDGALECLHYRNGVGILSFFRGNRRQLQAIKNSRRRAQCETSCAGWPSQPVESRENVILVLGLTGLGSKIISVREWASY